MTDLLKAATVWRNLAIQEKCRAGIAARYEDISSYEKRIKSYIKCDKTI